MKKVYKSMQDDSMFHVDYNEELFAGMFLKPKTGEYPTILLFGTGSYTMMGATRSNICAQPNFHV